MVKPVLKLNSNEVYQYRSIVKYKNIDIQKYEYTNI